MRPEPAPHGPRVVGESCDHTAVLTSVAAALVAASLQTASSHAAHAPRLGGQFAAIAGDALHIEGLWEQQRRFVLVVTGPAGAGLPIERLRDFAARVEFADGSSAPLALTPDGTFDARIPALPLPARITVVVTTTAGEERAPLVFPTYTRATDANMFPLLPTEIPGTLPALLTALSDDISDARLLLDRNEVFFVYAAAVRARDRALALESYVSDLPPAHHARARSAVLDLVRASWLLHVAADSGTSAEARAAANALDATLRDVLGVFSRPGR